MAQLSIVIAIITALFASGNISAVQSIKITDDDNISDLDLVKNYVVSHANETFRAASGFLNYSYLVPSGPYDQCWDWDSVFTGVALLELGSAPYLAGSMMNFLEATNGSDGFVTQCLDPTTKTPSCSSSNDSSPVNAHAKPLIIQGAYFAAQYMNDYAQFYPYKSKMIALLRYWTNERVDIESGLFTWHDQMESGADNLVTSQCPTSRSDCWNESEDANTLASSDVIVELIREEQAYSAFLQQWSILIDHNQADIKDVKTYQNKKYDDIKEQENKHKLNHENEKRMMNKVDDEKSEHDDAIEKMISALNEGLWDNELGCFVALNTSTRNSIQNMVYLAAFPLFGGTSVLPQSRADSVAQRINNTDMLSAYGLRSTSSNDPRFSNENTIYPYSNWRGPIWVVANAAVAYGLAEFGHKDLATELVSRITSVLAADLRNTGTWHECYDSGDENNTSITGGVGLAAEGFLSWNTLGYRLMDDIANGINPFSLDIDSYY